MAVFTRGITDEQRKEMINYAKCDWEFVGEYSDPEKLLEDAGQRVVERHGNAFHVIKEGKFGYLLVYDFSSLSREITDDLQKVFGIHVLSFKKQMEIKETERKEDPTEIEVNLEDEGDYKVVKL
jgi:hypothetical protein